MIFQKHNLVWVSLLLGNDLYMNSVKLHLTSGAHLSSAPFHHGNAPPFSLKSETTESPVLSHIEIPGSRMQRSELEPETVVLLLSSVWAIAARAEVRSAQCCKRLARHGGAHLTYQAKPCLGFRTLLSKPTDDFFLLKIVLPSPTCMNFSQVQWC